MTVILIRHGETPLNRARILQPPDTPLSELGRRQAQAMADRLRDEPIGAVLASDMTRAAQTAAPLAKNLGLPIAYSTVLHERSFGDLRGQKFSDLDFDPMASGYHPPNGESWEMFHERVAQAFEVILEAAAREQQTLAVVSHGLVIRELVKRHLSSALDVPERLENTSVTVFGKTAPHSVSLLACDKHLAGIEDHGTGGGLA